MITLIYVSQATHPLNDEELRALLEVSRRNNEPKNITGMLLYRDDGFFIQVIEGDTLPVHTLYEKIQHDPRHKHIIRVMEYEIAARNFPDWRMGFNKVTHESVAQLEGFSNFMELNPSDFLKANPGRVQSLLESFRDHTFF
jgi:hypothetical protein